MERQTRQTNRGRKTESECERENRKREREREKRESERERERERERDGGRDGMAGGGLRTRAGRGTRKAAHSLQ